jgi:serine/threonine-protein kinase HipA
MILNRCPSTLAPGFETFSPAARKRLFGNQTVSHLLPYDSVNDNPEDAGKFLENSEHVSLSGVQSKFSMIIRRDQLALTNESEQGTFILKPKLTQFQNSAFSPANEHLTMQIAEQVFKMDTASSTVCFFRTGEPAYLTKRFDVAPDGTKLRKEDFASLAGLTSDNAGKKYKYDALSYEDIALLIRQYVPAWKVDMLNYFRLVLYNFLICNGDAHLKNFSVLETPDGDFRLAPAYDLMDTKLHVDDRIFALEKGLFKKKDQSLNPLGLVTGKTFQAWGNQIGLPKNIVQRELDRFCASYEKMDQLVDRSFLSDELKALYKTHYTTRRETYLKS